MRNNMMAELVGMALLLLVVTWASGTMAEDRCDPPKFRFMDEVEVKRLGNRAVFMQCGKIGNVSDFRQNSFTKRCEYRVKHFNCCDVYRDGKLWGADVWDWYEADDLKRRKP